MENFYIKTNGMIEIFCPYIWKNGKKIYPKKAKVFHFWVPSVKEPNLNR